MKPKILKITLIILFVAISLGCKSERDDLTLLKTWMTGSFSSAEQAASDTSFFDISLEMVPIWFEREDGPWLYVEQAVAKYKDKPYRQRVYNLVKQKGASIASVVYTIPKSMRFAGDWQKEKPLKQLTPDSLTRKTGCEVVLKFDNQTFRGSTVDRNCSSVLRGATYATSEVIITATEIISWDRGFDTDGNQIWGAEKSGYIFKKL